MSTAPTVINPLASLSIRGATSSSITTVCGKLLNQCVLASIAVQNSVAGDRGAAYVGAAPPSKSGALQWQTYDNYYNAIAEREMARVRQRQPGHSGAATGAAKKAAPKRTHRAPVTITTRPRQMLAAALSLLADLACSARGGNGLASITGQACPEAALVRGLVALTESMQPVLKSAPLSSDNRMAVQVRHILDLLVGSRSGTIVPAVAVASAASAAAYVEPLTALFMNFLRCVAWQTAALAFESGRGKAARTWTLNRENLCGILISLGPLSAEMHALKQFMVDQASALEDHLALAKDAGSVASTATSATDKARAEPVGASAHDVFLPDGAAPADDDESADSESDDESADSESGDSESADNGASAVAVGTKK